MITNILTCLSIFLISYKRLDTRLVLFICLGALILGIVLTRGEKSHSLLKIDQIAESSSFKNTHPLLKLVYSLGVIVIISLSKGYSVALVSMAMSAVFFISSKRLGMKELREVLAPGMFFILTGCLAVLIEFTPKDLGYIDFYFISVTRQGQIRALDLILRSTASLLCLMSLGLTSKIGDIIYALKKIRCPQIITELMYLIYRYIFILFYQLKLMESTSYARLGFSSRRASLRTFKYMASRLFNRSISLSLASYKAMEARVYEGDLEFISPKYQLGPRSLVYFIFPLVLLALVIGGRLYG